jgi:hypothetical protein
MRGLCRGRMGPSWRRRQRASEELLRHVRIVTDPVKLAYLYAEAKRQRANADVVKEESQP